jgi:hypothetical protein
MGRQTATHISKCKSSCRCEECSQASVPQIAASGPHADVLDLQHAAGNRAVSEVVQSSHTASRGNDVPPIVRSVLNSSGQPLDPATRAFMEPRFGHDFSQVRVHNNALAHQAAGGQLARAFTVGTHVVFGPRRYEPTSIEGKRLLAHELAHVVQQAGPESGASASARHEIDADHAATAAIQGRPAAVLQRAPVGVQREPLSEEEIAKLPLDQVEARLAANEDESSPIVLNESAQDRLEEERRSLIKRRDKLSGVIAPGINAPIKSADERWKEYQEMLEHTWDVEGKYHDSGSHYRKMSAVGTWRDFVTVEELRHFLDRDPNFKELYYRWREFDNKWRAVYEKERNNLQTTSGDPPASGSTGIHKRESEAQSDDDIYKRFVEAPQWKRDEATAAFRSVTGHLEPEPNPKDIPPPSDVGCHTDPHKASKGQPACRLGHHKTQDQATRVTAKLLQGPALREFQLDLERSERAKRAQLDRLNQAHWHWQRTKEYIHRDEFSPYEIEKDNIIPTSIRWDTYNRSDPKNLETADFDEHFFRSKEEYEEEKKRRREEYVEAFEACNDRRGLKWPKASRKRPEYLDCQEKVQAEYFPGRAALQDASRRRTLRDIEVGMPAVTDQGFVAATVFHIAHEWLGWSTDRAAAAAGFVGGIANIAGGKIDKIAAQRQSGGGSSGPPGKTPPPIIEPHVPETPAERLANQPDKPAALGQTPGAPPQPVRQPPPVQVSIPMPFVKPPANDKAPPTDFEIAIQKRDVKRGAPPPPVQRSTPMPPAKPPENENAERLPPLARTGTDPVAMAGGKQSETKTVSGSVGSVAGQTSKGVTPPVGPSTPQATRAVGGTPPKQVTAPPLSKDQLQAKLPELEAQKLDIERDIKRQKFQVEAKNKRLNDLSGQNISTHGSEITQAKKRLNDETVKLGDAEGRWRQVQKEIDSIHRELAKGATPWREARLTGPDSAARVGLYGELEVNTRLQAKEWELMGKTIKPDDIRLPGDFEAAVQKYKGTTGIDTPARRTTKGKNEFLIVESKATLDKSAPTPSGKGELKTTASGDQLSRSWTTGNLPKLGLSPTERAEIETARKEGRVHFVYAQTIPGKGTRFFKIEHISDTEVRIGEPFDP